MMTRVSSYWVLVMIVLFFDSCTKDIESYFERIEGEWSLEELVLVGKNDVSVLIHDLHHIILFPNCNVGKGNSADWCSGEQYIDGQLYPFEYYVSADVINVRLYFSNEEEWNELPMATLGKFAYVYNVRLTKNMVLELTSDDETTIRYLGNTYQRIEYRFRKN